MFCTQCGSQLAENARFCTTCGKPVDGPGMGPGQADAGYAGQSYSAPPKRLHRVIGRKKIAGVCAGFADYFDVDLTLMRVIWVALALLPPQLGLIAYVVAWAVLPKE